MTAETLKPFITPNGVDHFPPVHTTKRPPLKSNFFPIVLTATCITFAVLMLSLAVWNTVRISELETELRTQNDLIKKMQERLGLNFLDDIAFEKGYANALIDDPTTLDDLDNEDNEDDDDIDGFDVDDDDEDDVDDDDDADNEDEDDVDVDYYDEIKKFISNNEGDDDSSDYSNTSEDDNVYHDFEKFKDSKKKKQSSLNSREKRSIANKSNGLPIYETSFLEKLNKTEVKAPSEELEKTAAKNQQHKEHRNRKPVMRAQSANAEGAHKPRDDYRRYIVGEKRDERRYSPLRQNGHHRRRKFPIVKSAKSTATASSTTYTPAAHFHLNNKVPHHRSAIRVDQWRGDMYIGTPSWSNEATYQDYFTVENGIIKVKVPGLYYIYAQVCYNNSHDQNGFVIFHDHEPYLQCLNTVPTNMLKVHTCHTSGLIYLNENETIHLRDFHSERNVILNDSSGRSYFGLIKI